MFALLLRSFSLTMSVSSLTTGGNILVSRFETSLGLFRSTEMLFCNHFSGRSGLSVIVFVCLSLSAAAVEQSPPGVSFRNRVVDLIILDNQLRLHGVSLPGRPGAFLFRTEWLRTETGDFFAGDVAPKIAESLPNPASVAVQQRLEQELRLLMTQPDQHLTQIGLIREFLSRRQNAEVSIPRLVVIEFAPDLIRRHEPQSKRNQHLGLLAMLNDVARPEVISWTSVAENLTAIPVEQRIHTLPADSVLTAEQHSQRVLAAVDYRSQRYLEFVSTGSRLIQKDGTSPLPVLFSQMLQDTVTQQLRELLDAEPGNNRPGKSLSDQIPQELPEAARSAAESRQFRTIMVTGFILQPDISDVTVWRVLYFSDAPGRWFPVIRSSGRAGVVEVSQEQQTAIAADPQIRQISELLATLNVNSNLSDQAFRMGAAVQLASERNEAAFQNTLADILTADMPTGNSIPTVRLQQLTSTLPQ